MELSQIASQTDRFEFILPQHLDSTMMSAFRACPTKWAWEFGYGLRPSLISPDLHAGGCFAKAIEMFQRAYHEEHLNFQESLKKATRLLYQEWGDYVPPEKNPKTVDRMGEALVDYFTTYHPGTDRVRPYRDASGASTLEFSFAIPLDFPGFPLHPVTGDPFIYCGRFDLLGELSGRPCVRDEKTAKAAGDKWAEQWDLRAQFMGYVWGGLMSGIENLETVVVRGVIIQKTQFKQLEAIKVFPKYMIDRWFEQLRKDVNRLVVCYERGDFDYNFGESCTAYGNCMFQGLCTAPEPARWMTNFVIRRWNPLLHNPVALLPETA